MGSRAIQTLTDLLPEQTRRFDLYGGSEPAIEYIDDANPFFVEPPLKEQERDGSAPIKIVSAPAAVGKSTLARELCQRLNALYWHLGSTPFGAHSFTGALDVALGSHQKEELRGMLSAGTGLIVLDALDEALLSSQHGFAGFVQDICNWVGTDAPGIVVFARHAAAEEFAFHVLECGKSFDWIAIDYFDNEEDAASLIKSYLRHNKDTKVDPDDPQLESARALLFSILSSILLGQADAKSWEDPRVRQFLGYAPVLVSIARFLNVGNPHALVQELQRDLAASAVGNVGGTRRARWTLLEQIIGELLRRERDEKVMDHLEDWFVSSGKGVGRSATFKSVEQLSRVLADVLDDKALIEDSMTYMPNSAREDYEQIMARQVVDHVLLGEGPDRFANIVFRDYVFAWGLVKCPGAVPALEARLANRFLPTQLFGEFLLFFSSDEDDLRVDRKYTGYVCESLISEAQRNSDLEIVIESREDRNLFCLAMPNNDPSSAFSFRLTGDTEGEVRFWRSLRRARVEYDCVALGFTGETFRLGPDIDLRTQSLTIPADSLTIVANEEQPVTVVARQPVDQSVPSKNVEVVGGPDDAIRIFLDGARGYPWSRWRFEPEETIDNEDLWSAFLTLTRILWWFRSMGHSDLARTERLLENPAISGGYRGRQMLEFLVAQNVLQKRSGLYFLNRDKAADLGINFVQLRQRKLTEEVALLLQRFLAD